MTMLKHPYSGLYYNDRDINTYASLVDDGMSFDGAVVELVAEGYEVVRFEYFDPHPTTLVANIAMMLATTLAQHQPVPSGFRPGDPNPDQLTEEEAIRYLRLDTINIKNRDETLQRYRKTGNLKGTQVSKSVFYLRSELDDFLKRMTDKNPR